MRVTLSAACLFGTLSALAPTLELLVLARACTGACIAAAVPSALVYVGDVVPFARRQGVLTDLNAASALGITGAIGLGGVLAATVGWRVAFLLPALLAGALSLVLRRLPEPPRHADHQGGLALALRSVWGRRVLLLALVEGAALLGLLTYLAPAVESRGASPTQAGGLVGLYGVGLLLTSRVVKRLAGRLPPPVFLAAGSSALVVAYAAVALSQVPGVVAAAALLVGAGWASMHSTMQAWATEVVPRARATIVSLFAAALFVGSGAATAALAPLAGDLRWGPVFGVGVALAGGFGVAAVIATSRFGRRPAVAA
ncbi:MAG: major facilitator superfamily 1, partial [Frankiales bacterium]|nr:major facilitator superfamily 1 [Frankiales bacterium]